MFKTSSVSKIGQYLGIIISVSSILKGIFSLIALDFAFLHILCMYCFSVSCITLKCFLAHSDFCSFTSGLLLYSVQLA
nr:MAG TPA: hypothetical protein [Caudoviricetes sp.]